VCCIYYRAYSKNHIIGACIVAAAVLLSITPPLRDAVAYIATNHSQSQVQSQTHGAQQQVQQQSQQSHANRLNGLRGIGSYSDVAAEGLNTVVFALSAIPAVACQLYKERAIGAYGLPVDPQHLNMWLGLFQFLLLVLTCPVAYHLQVSCLKTSTISVLQQRIAHFE
jgi:hypothetical protein